MMLDHARSAGVEVHEQVHTDEVLFEEGQAMGVRVTVAGGGTCEVRAKVVVDASGRACVVGRQLGLREPLPELRKASVWGCFRGGRRLPGIDAGETTMFLIPGGGWFWYIPLPDDVVSVGIVADPEHVFGETDDLEAILAREIAKCAGLADRLSAATRVGPVHGVRHGDVSAPVLGAFEPALWKGVDVVRRLIHAFYDPAFSFPKFAERFPQHRAALIDCLVGDVVKDLGAFTEALAQMTPPPPPLGSNLPGPVAVAGGQGSRP